MASTHNKYNWHKIKRKVKSFLKIEKKQTGVYRKPKIHASIRREGTFDDGEIITGEKRKRRNRLFKYKGLKKIKLTKSQAAKKKESKLKKKKIAAKIHKKKLQKKKKISIKRLKAKRKERRIRYLQKYFPFLALFGIISYAKDSNGDEMKSKIHMAFFFYFLNSTALFILAYFTVYFIYQITVIIMSAFWGLAPTWYYYDLAFNDISPLWNRFNILAITFSGPFVSVIIGLVSYLYLARKRKLSPYLRLFYIWVGLHGLNMFFGAFASGVAFDEGFGYVPIWLYWPVAARILFSIIMLFSLGLFAFYSTKLFLNTSNSSYRIKHENRQYFILNQILLPAIIGSLLIFLVKLPKIFPYEIGLLLIMALISITTLFNYDAKPSLRIPNEPKTKTKINLWIVILSFIVLVGFRILFASGMHIVLILKFALSITPL